MFFQILWDWNLHQLWLQFSPLSQEFGWQSGKVVWGAVLTWIHQLGRWGGGWTAVGTWNSSFFLCSKCSCRGRSGLPPCGEIWESYLVQGDLMKHLIHRGKKIAPKLKEKIKTLYCLLKLKTIHFAVQQKVHAWLVSNGMRSLSSWYHATVFLPEADHLHQWAISAHAGWNLIYSSTKYLLGAYCVMGLLGSWAGVRAQLQS